MKTLQCPACGSPDIVAFGEGEYRCDHCGTFLLREGDQTELVVSGTVCPDCGLSNKRGDKYCANCGKNLTKYCITCGTEAPLERRYCAECGERGFSDQPLQSVILRPGFYKQYNKLGVIKTLRDLYGVGVFEAKQVAERDSVIASGIVIEEALKMKEKYEAFGAVVELKDEILPLDGYLK